MIKLEYKEVPKKFKNLQEKLIFVKLEIAIKYYLLEFLHNHENKNKVLKDLVTKGFIVDVNGKDYKVFKSYGWLKRAYYSNLKSYIILFR